jgi:hypothetical protein
MRRMKCLSLRLSISINYQDIPYWYATSTIRTNTTSLLICIFSLSKEKKKFNWLMQTTNKNRWANQLRNKFRYLKKKKANNKYNNSYHISKCISKITNQ